MADSLPAQIFLAAFLAFLLGEFALYHFMVFRVNKYLDVGEKFPHSISIGQRVKLREVYNSFYPRSLLYHFTMTFAVAMLLFAFGFAVFRIWSTAGGAIQH